MIVLLLFLAQIINYFDKVVVGVAAIPMMKDLGISREQFGYVAGSLFALFAISGIGVGLLVVKRVMPKWLLTVLVLVWSMAQLPIAFTSALWVVVASRMALGAGEGPIGGTVVNACFSWFPREKRSLPIAVCTLGNGVGILAGSPILNYVVLTYGWRQAFLVCGALGFMWLALWIPLGANGPYLDTPNPDTPNVARSEPFSIGMDLSKWLSPTLVASFVVAFCSFWTVGFSVAWMPSYLRAGLGYDPKLVGWLLSIIAAAGSVLSFAIAAVSQWLLSKGISSRVAGGYLNGASLILGAISLMGSVAVHPGVSKLALLAIGFAFPLVTFSVGPPMVAEAAPQGEGQSAIVTIYAASTLAGLASPIAASYLMQAGDRGGAHRGYDFALVSASVILMIGGLVAFRWLDPKRGKIATHRRSTVSHLIE